MNVVKDLPQKNKKLKQEKKKENINVSDESEYADWEECRIGLSEEQCRVFLELQAGSVSADDLVERTQIEARRVLSALTMLQIRGLVVEESGNRFRSAVRLKME